MDFRIVQSDSPRETGDPYEYRIYQGNRLIAHYWHDFRGDENGITFADGESDIWPSGLSQFLSGGGPQPLRLSEDAVAYLKRKTAPIYSQPGSERARAILQVLCSVNPLRIDSENEAAAHGSYAKYTLHIELMLKNGCRPGEVADYLEKIVLQRSLTLDRDAAIRLAGELLRAASLPVKSPENTREG